MGLPIVLYAFENPSLPNFNDLDSCLGNFVNVGHRMIEIYRDIERLLGISIDQSRIVVHLFGH